MSTEIVVPVSDLMFARNGNTAVVVASDGTEVALESADGGHRTLADGIARAVLTTTDFHLVASFAEGSDVKADNGVTYRIRVKG